MESKVEIFIEYGKETFIIEFPREITYSKLKDLLIKNKIIEKDGVKKNYLYIEFKGISYDENNLNEVIKLEEGDKIEIKSYRIDEGINAEFHKNINLNEGDINNIKPLTGILRLILVKYISSYITDISKFSPEIEKILKELKEGMKLAQGAQKDIKSNLEEKEGHNILVYSNYICSVIDDDKINFMLKQLPENKVNEIKKYWSILSIYEEFNQYFEKELYDTLERSYFDYSLVALSIYEQSNRKKYLKEMNACPNREVKYLFHGTEIDPVSKIITTGFLYTRQALFGMGIYFSDMLDYASFYAGGIDKDGYRINFNNVLPVDAIFSCVSAEVYYSKDLKKDIYDDSLYVPALDHFPSYEEIKTDWGNQMVEKNGVHFIRVEPSEGSVRNRKEITNDIKSGKFLGTEYVITEMDQILPLYGLTFKRNEYIVIWRDNHFKGQNDYSDYLKERKLFIYEYAKMNAYFTVSIEKALEIIKRKKYNKIILISNIGQDLSGKKFVEVARKILGFNVPVLFFSGNQSHLSWLKDFPNALYTNQDNYYEDYILNYNEEGLLKLKKEIESNYEVKLKFEKDFLKFPYFISQGKYDKLSFEESNPYFKRVVIRNVQNQSIFCMNENRKAYFDSNPKLDVNKFIWYITLMGNEITLYSNESYLSADLNSKKAIGYEYMLTYEESYKFEKIKDNEYLIYYKDKNNVLTVSGSNAILQKENSNKNNQKFKLIENLDFLKNIDENKFRLFE